MLAVQGPPGGSPQDLVEHVDQIMEEHPVQFLFTKTLVGPDNASAVFRAATPEDHRRLALAEQRAQQARIWGVFCAEALQRIGRRADKPDRGDPGSCGTRGSFGGADPDLDIRGVFLVCSRSR